MIVTAIYLIQFGWASVYVDRQVACPGEKYSANAMTVAHQSLPCGAIIEIENIRNGKKVIARVNDRGPFTRGRIVDVTPRVAALLGYSGVAPVSIKRIQ